jgi:hypothetical protein
MKKDEKGEKEEEANVIAVNQLYDVFRRPDISSLLDMFTDDAVIHGPAPGGVLPWGGAHYDVRELQNSSWLLANHLESNSLSCGIIHPKATRL